MKNVTLPELPKGYSWSWTRKSVFRKNVLNLLRDGKVVVSSFVPGNKPEFARDKAEFLMEGLGLTEN